MPKSLVEVFHRVFDPRSRQGLIHDLVPTLSLAVVAILSRLQGVLGNKDQLCMIAVAKQGDWAIIQGPNVTQEGTGVWLERHVGQN